MNENRMMTLLNQIIDHVSCARNTSETIGELVNMGFSTEELVEYFNFSQSDVDDFMEEAEEYEDE